MEKLKNPLYFSMCNTKTKETFEVLRCKENLSTTKFECILNSLIQVEEEDEFGITHHTEYLTIVPVKFTIEEAFDVLQKYTLPNAVKAFLLLIYEDHVPYGYIEIQDYNNKKTEMLNAISELGLSVGCCWNDRLFITLRHNMKYIAPHLEMLYIC